jgi:two-component system NarL family response regulator
MHQAEPPTSRAAVRVLLVEDHTVVRQAFCLLLADARYGIEIIGEAGDGVEAVALAQTLLPDVIVMDLLMPRMGGLEATQAILRVNSGARVLTSDEDEADALTAIRAGALGFVPKHASIDELVHTIHSVALDQMVVPRALAAHLAFPPAPEASPHPALPALTAREQEVLACLTQGLGNREIARTLKISTATVRSHISHLLPKLDATNRTQAVVHANGFGMLGNSRRERNQ